MFGLRPGWSYWEPARHGERSPETFRFAAPGESNHCPLESEPNGERKYQLESVASEIDAKTVEQETKFCLMVDRVVNAKDREVRLQDGNGQCVRQFGVLVRKITPKIEIQSLDRSRIAAVLRTSCTQI